MKDELLIRFFNEKKYAEDFIQGKIFMNYLGKYWGPDIDKLSKKYRDKNTFKKITPAQFGRDDFYEGAIALQNKGSSEIAEALGKDHVMGNVIYRIDAYRYCNLLCMYAVDIDHENKKIYLPDSIRMGREFGRYAVIIKDKKYFINTLTKHLDSAWKYIYGRVTYSDFLNDESIFYQNHVLLQTDELPQGIFNVINKSILNNTARPIDIFDKIDLLKHQKEWRLCVYRNTDNESPLIVELPDLSKCMEFVDTDKLTETIRKKYPDHSYSLVQPENIIFNGNITREAFQKMMYDNNKIIKALLIVK